MIRHSLFIAFIASLVLTIGINNPFTSTGEPREALVAQSMLMKGDSLNSVRYDEDLATKPPLFHWNILLISKYIGKVTEAASRIPSVLSAIVTLLAWFLFIYKRISKEKAILSAFILLTAPEWYRHASLARIDMTLTMFTTLSLILLFNWLQSNNKKYLWISIIFLSLGTLTKGPIGIIIPMGISFIFAIYLKKLSIRNFFLILVASCLSLILWIEWFHLQLDEESRNLLHIAFLENFGRFFDDIQAGKDPHSKSIFYFFCSFMAGFTPWVLVFILSIKVFLKNKLLFFSNPHEKQFFIWCIISVLFCLVFFMIPDGKRGVYLLPIYPAMSTIFAIILCEIEQKSPHLVKKTITILSYFFSFIWLLVCLINFNIIDISFLSSSKAGKEILFYLSLVKVTNISTLIVCYNLLPLIASVVILSCFSQYKNYFFRFSLILTLFFSFTRLILLNPATEKLSSKPFIERSLKDTTISSVTMLAHRMYPTIFYIRNYNPNIQVFDFNEDTKNYPENIFLWQSDRNLLKDIDNYEITTSDYQVEKSNRFLEFAKKSNK